MADILEGTSGHVQHAPLSTNQTLQLCRHLSEQTKALGASFRELREDLSQVVGAVHDLTGDVGNLKASTLTLKDNFGDNQQALEKAKKEVLRLDQRMQKLEVGLETSGEATKALAEGQRLGNTRYEAVFQDLANMHTQLKELQAGLDRNFMEDRSDRGSTDELGRKLAASVDAVNRSLSDQANTLGEVTLISRKLRTEALKNGTMLQALQDGFATQAKSMKRLEGECEEAVASCTRARQEHEATKIRVAESSKQLQQVMTTSARMDQELHKATGGLHLAQQRLNEAQSLLVKHGGQLESQRNQVEHLQGEHSQAERLLHWLQRRVEEVSHVAQSVKVGLRETNAIVLPNVLMEPAAAGIVLKTKSEAQELSSFTRSQGPGPRAQGKTGKQSGFRGISVPGASPASARRLSSFPLEALSAP